jgi:hypothetical protein
MLIKFLPLIYLTIGLNGAIALFNNPGVPLSLFPWYVWVLLVLCSLNCGKNFWNFHNLPPMTLDISSFSSVGSIWLRLAFAIVLSTLLGRITLWIFTSTADLPHSSALVLGAALSLSAVTGMQRLIAGNKVQK